MYPITYATLNPTTTAGQLTVKEAMIRNEGGRMESRIQQHTWCEGSVTSLSCLTSFISYMCIQLIQMGG
jgi:hypothetical protein